jgi:hypothetical protein
LHTKDGKPMTNHPSVVLTDFRLREPDFGLGYAISELPDDRTLPLPIGMSQTGRFCCESLLGGSDEIS